jgi:hypothetical protein
LRAIVSIVQGKLVSMIRLRRSLCAIAFFAVSLPVAAQESYSPSSVVCGLVNFRFCDQGVRPPPPEYVPEPTDQRAEAPPPKPKAHKKPPVKKTKPPADAPDKAVD